MVLFCNLGYRFIYLYLYMFNTYKRFRNVFQLIVLADRYHISNVWKVILWGNSSLQSSVHFKCFFLPLTV